MDARQLSSVATTIVRPSGSSTSSWASSPSCRPYRPRSSSGSQPIRPRYQPSPRTPASTLSPPVSRSVTSWVVTSSRCPVGGPAGVEQMVADPDAVDPQLVVAQRRHVQAGAHGSSGQVEGPAQQRRRRLAPCAGVVGKRHRDRAPVRGLEQAGLHSGGGAPGGPAVLRRDADAQVPHLAAGQGPARRYHIELIQGFHRPRGGHMVDECRRRRRLQLVAELPRGRRRGHGPVGPQRGAARRSVR